MGLKNYTAIVRAACKRFLGMSDLEALLYSSHTWRRSAATILANHGLAIQEIMRMGRWKNEEVVMGYVENSEATKAKQVSVLSGLPFKSPQEIEVERLRNKKLGKRNSPAKNSKATAAPDKSSKLSVPDLCTTDSIQSLVSHGNVYINCTFNGPVPDSPTKKKRT